MLATYPRPAVPDRFPRPVLLAIGGFVALVIALAAYGRLSGMTEVPRNVAAVATRDLHFADRADRGVDVLDAARGDARLQTVTGQAGFLRGTLRGLASARKRAGIGPEIPFRLTAWQDGRLTLDDPTDHRHVELEAFGPTNEAVFTDILKAPEPPFPSKAHP